MVCPLWNFPGEGVGLLPPGRCHIDLLFEVLWAPFPLLVHAGFCHAMSWYDAVVWTVGCCCYLHVWILPFVIRFSSSLASNVGV